MPRFELASAQTTAEPDGKVKVSGNDVAHIGSVVAPFAMGLEGFLVDSPHERAQVTELHHHYYYCVLTLHSHNIPLFLCFIRSPLTPFCTSVCFALIALYVILALLTPAQRDAHHSLWEQIKITQAGFVLPVNRTAAVVTTPRARKQCSPPSSSINTHAAWKSNCCFVTLCMSDAKKYVSAMILTACIRS